MDGGILKVCTHCQIFAFYSSGGSLTLHKYINKWIYRSLKNSLLPVCACVCVCVVYLGILCNITKSWEQTVYFSFVTILHTLNCSDVHILNFKFKLLIFLFSFVIKGLMYTFYITCFYSVSNVYCCPLCCCNAGPFPTVALLKDYLILSYLEFKLVLHNKGCWTYFPLNQKIHQYTINWWIQFLFHNWL